MMPSIPETASTTATAANCPVSPDTLADTESDSSSTEIVPVVSKPFDKRFPPEIHFAIFERIENAVTSTCLGLTCTSLYAIHWAQRGKVDLREYAIYGSKQEHDINLGLLLKSWMPSHLAYDFKAGKFINYTTLASQFIEWEEEEEGLWAIICDKNDQVREAISRERQLKQQLEQASDRLCRANKRLKEALDYIYGPRKGVFSA